MPLDVSRSWPEKRGIHRFHPPTHRLLGNRLPALSREGYRCGTKLAHPRPMEVDGRRLRLAMGAGSIAGSPLSPAQRKRAETNPFPMAMATQCSKVRSDEVRDGPSLRSQAAIAPAVLPSPKQKATIHLVLQKASARRSLGGPLREVNERNAKASSNPRSSHKALGEPSRMSFVIFSCRATAATILSIRRGSRRAGW